MENDGVIITNANEIEAKHQNMHKDYEYYKKTIINGGERHKCNAAIYEISPGKSAYPYHYHYQSEELFYIISGTGRLRTPDGERTVKAGDILFFPASEKGAHKLTNLSDIEKLIYLDFDTYHSPEICFYPDSDKINVFGKGFRRVIKSDMEADYYDGE